MSHSPGLLTSFIKEQQKITKKQWLLVFGIAFLVNIAWLFFPTLKLLIFLLALLLLFTWRPNFGLLIVASVCLFSGWVIYFSHYQWLSNAGWVAGLNAPMGDLLMLVLLVALLRYVAQCKLVFKRSVIIISLSYLVFLGFALLSALQAYDHSIGESWHYLLRFYLFIYLAFSLVPLFLIKNKSQLEVIFCVWFWVGMLISVFGLSSFVFAEQVGNWWRVRPFAIGGWAPLGDNHNQIAEALVAIIPAVFYLAYRTKEKLYYWGGLFITLIALLTLSRSAWLGIGIELLIFAWFFRTAVIGWLKDRPELVKISAVLLLLLIGYMAVFLSSTITASSTQARLETIKVSWFYAGLSPWFGYGPGMYVPLTSSIRSLRLDFGEALEAHSFLQKIVVETGLFGSLALLLFFIILFYYLIKQVQQSMDENKILSLALLAMIAGELAFQMFGTSYFTAVLWLPIGLGLANLKQLEND